MMAKYIDADTMVGLRFFDDTCGREKTTIEVDTIENILDNFTEEGCPEPADVVEVKHGEWIHMGCGVFECDKCGKRISTNVYVREEASDRFKFCPSCGSKMDGKKRK